MHVSTTSVNSRRPSAWWRHFLFWNGYSFIIFRRRSKIIAFLESVIFLRVSTENVDKTLGTITSFSRLISSTRLSQYGILSDVSDKFPT